MKSELERIADALEAIKDLLEQLVRIEMGK